jgi:prefoldin subunit 5
MQPTLLTFTPLQTVEARCAKLEGLLETLKTEHDNNRQEIAAVVAEVQTLETAIRHLRDESQQMVEIDGKFYISRQKAVVVVLALQSMLMDLGS